MEIRYFDILSLPALGGQVRDHHHFEKGTPAGFITTAVFLLYSSIGQFSQACRPKLYCSQEGVYVDTSLSTEGVLF